MGSLDQFMQNRGINPQKPCPEQDRVDSYSNCTNAAKELREAWGRWVETRARSCQLVEKEKAAVGKSNCGNNNTACFDSASQVTRDAAQAIKEERDAIKEVRAKVQKLHETSVKIASGGVDYLQKAMAESISNPNTHGEAANLLRSSTNKQAYATFKGQDPTAANDVVAKFENRLKSVNPDYSPTHSSIANSDVTGGVSSKDLASIKAPLIREPLKLALVSEDFEQKLAERESRLNAMSTGFGGMGATDNGNGRNMSSINSGGRSGVSPGEMASMGNMASAGMGAMGGGAAPNSQGANTSGINNDNYGQGGAGNYGYTGASTSSPFTAGGPEGSRSPAGPGWTGTPGGYPGFVPVAANYPVDGAEGAGVGANPAIGAASVGAESEGAKKTAAKGGATTAGASLFPGGPGSAAGGGPGTGGASLAAAGASGEGAGEETKPGGGAARYPASVGAGGDAGDLGMGGMDATLGTGKFALASSDTDAAIKGMVSEFSESLGEDANGLGAKGAGAEILSGDSKTLFIRTKEAHLRALKRGNLIDHGKIRI